MGKHGKHKSKKRDILRIVLIVLAVICVVSSGLLFLQIWEKQQGIYTAGEAQQEILCRMAQPSDIGPKPPIPKQGL